MTRIVMVSDFVEENGKTIRENNLERIHNVPLGAVVSYQAEVFSDSKPCKVNLKGRCTLLVVGHMRDCDGSPLYVLSDLPVFFPLPSNPMDPTPEEGLFRQKMVYKFFAQFVQTGVRESAFIVEPDKAVRLQTMREYAGVKE